MRSSDAVLRRVLTGTAAAALTFGWIMAAGAASADVFADAEDPVRGEHAVVTFQVPNESATGSATTQVIVNLPAMTSVTTRAMHGWTNRFERDPAAGTVRSITWSAHPGGGIHPDHFEVFSVHVKLPDADAVTFPVTQVYADGTTVQWDQPPVASHGEPEHPAPMLALLPAVGNLPHDLSRAQHEGTLTSLMATAIRERQLGPDNVARALGGGALLLATLGVGISVVRRRG